MNTGRFMTPRPPSNNRRYIYHNGGRYPIYHRNPTPITRNRHYTPGHLPYNYRGSTSDYNIDKYGYKGPYTPYSSRNKTSYRKKSKKSYGRKKKPCKSCCIRISCCKKCC